MEQVKAKYYRSVMDAMYYFYLYVETLLSIKKRDRVTKRGKRIYERITTDIMDQGAWSPVGTYIAATDVTGWLYVWEAETGQKVFERQAHAYSLSALRWSPTGRELVTCDTAGNVVIWEVPSGRVRYRYEYPEEESDAEGRGGSQTRAAWSPDGQFLASNGLVGSQRVLEVWNASTGERRAAWAVGPYAASLLWSPNGKYLAMGDDRGVVHLWNLFTGKRVKSYRRPRMTQLNSVIHTSRSPLPFNLLKRGWVMHL